MLATAATSVINISASPLRDAAIGLRNEHLAMKQPACEPKTDAEARPTPTSSRAAEIRQILQDYANDQREILKRLQKLLN